MGSVQNDGCFRAPRCFFENRARVAVMRGEGEGEGGATPRAREAASRPPRARGPPGPQRTAWRCAVHRVGDATRRARRRTVARPALAARYLGAKIGNRAAPSRSTRIARRAGGGDGWRPC